MHTNTDEMQKSLNLKVDQINIVKKCGQPFDITGTVTAINHNTTATVVATLGASQKCAFADKNPVWGPVKLDADQPKRFSITTSVNCSPKGTIHFEIINCTASDDDDCSDTDKVSLEVEC